MSGYDGRSKGKRVRKLQSGSSNTQARWKYLGSDTSDVLASASSPALGKSRTLSRSLLSSAASPTRGEHHDQRHAATRASMDRGGYDIDGDGVVDAREMRMAKFLDAMVARHEREREPGARPDRELSEAERLGMRQQAGRLLIAKEFIERNEGHLWRYGSIFTGKDENQGAEFIAEHKNFKKLMAYLENVERQRSIRSSQQFRGCVRPASDQQEDGESERQTWVETSRKLRDPLFSKFPLPELQPKKLVPQFYTEGDEHDLQVQARRDKVAINAYGAIDIDGDGVIDDDEMKLHLRLQEATIKDNSRHQQQLEGRKMMARDFVARNDGRLWLFDTSYKHKSTDDVVGEIAASTAFSKDFNRLRAKERVLRLKSSIGVSGCLAQLEPPALREDPAQALEFRRVRDRSELLRARRELQKPLAMQRGILKEGDSGATAKQSGDPRQTFAVRLDARMGRVASESSVGLPRILDAPRRIEPTGSFSVTKWLLDA